MKTTVLKGKECYNIYDGIKELIEWRLDAIQECIKEKNWKEAESLFPRIRGLGLEFLKLSYRYDSIEDKIMVAGGGDHNDLSIAIYSDVGDTMYDLMSDEMELILYIENKRIMPVLALCDNRKGNKDIFRLEKETENNKRLFNYNKKRNSLFYKKKREA